jgi:hypothetical protein
VELPHTTPTAAASPRASGSRKRAREELPQHEQVIDEFNDALLSCRKWVKEAEVELARASRTAEVKRRVADRMAHKLEEALKTQKPQATLKENQKSSSSRAFMKTRKTSVCWP